MEGMTNAAANKTATERVNFMVADYGSRIVAIASRRGRGWSRLR